MPALPIFFIHVDQLPSSTVGREKLPAFLLPQILARWLVSTVSTSYPIFSLGRIITISGSPSLFMWGKIGAIDSRLVDPSSPSETIAGVAGIRTRGAAWISGISPAERQPWGYNRGMKSKGVIIIEPGVDVWPHEERTAEALAASGMTVRFLRRQEGDHIRTPDVVVDGERWEMKSPQSSDMDKVRKTLRSALGQSRNIIFDSRRIKGVPDFKIERELRKQAEAIRQIRRLVFVNKKREVIDIK